jgi:hypothetical protein
MGGMGGAAHDVERADRPAGGGRRRRRSRGYAVPRMGAAVPLHEIADIVVSTGRRR